jgi:hypothetical protein
MKIAALPDNLTPSHRVENGASYRIDPLFVGFSEIQLYCHDRHELRIEAIPVARPASVLSWRARG